MKYFYTVTIFYHKTNNVFLFSGTTIFYIKGKYLKLSQFFSEINIGGKEKGFCEVVKYF